MGVQAIKQGRAPAGCLHGECRQRWADVTTPVWTKELDEAGTTNSGTSARCAYDRSKI